MKQCKRCGLELPLSEFGLSGAAKGGHENTCKKCQSQRVLKYYAANREKRLAYQREYYYKSRGDKVNERKAQVVEGKVCTSCKGVSGKHTKDKSTKDGFNRQCTACVNAKAKRLRDAKKV